MKYQNLLIENRKIIIGKHNHIPDDAFDPIQLKIGIRVEKEHTNDLVIAKAIAKDHLMEIPDYYTRLLKMEKEYKLEKRRNKNGNYSKK